MPKNQITTDSASEKQDAPKIKVAKCNYCGGEAPAAELTFRLKKSGLPVCGVCGRHDEACISNERDELLQRVLEIASELQNNSDVEIDDVARDLERATKLAEKIFGEEISD